MQATRMDDMFSSVEHLQQIIEGEDLKMDVKGANSHRVRHKCGSTTYAEYITRALLTSPDTKLTLAEIYDWMADNVSGLNEQRHLHSSKGWKNAVRHTLSVNNRFHKITRVGRPSWWTVDSSVAHKYDQPKWGSHISINDDCDLVLQSESFRARTGSEPANYLSAYSRSPNTTLNMCTNSHDAMGVDVESSNRRQTIEVMKDDGTIGYVTVSKPIRFKRKVSEDSMTQTDDLPVIQNPINSYEFQQLDNSYKAPFVVEPTELTFLPELASLTEDQTFDDSFVQSFMDSMPSNFMDFYMGTPTTTNMNQ